MVSQKIKVILTVSMVLLLGIVSVAQAAPSLQGRSGTSQGHDLNLDEAGNNLGTVMSGQREVAATDIGSNNGQNPVATALATYFAGANYDEIMALHKSGVGFGNIAKAYFFTTKFDLGLGVSDLIAEAGQSGWGKVLKNNGIHPGSVGKGKANQPEQAGAKKTNNGQDNGDSNDDNGQGNGNNGKGHGNNGKDKDKGNAGSDDSDIDSADDGETDLDDDDAEVDDSNDDNDNGQGNGNSQGNNGNNGKSNNGKGKDN